MFRNIFDTNILTTIFRKTKWEKYLSQIFTISSKCIQKYKYCTAWCNDLSTLFDNSMFCVSMKIFEPLKMHAKYWCINQISRRKLKKNCASCKFGLQGKNNVDQYLMLLTTLYPVFSPSNDVWSRRIMHF